ncbi:hypothetical protein C5167_040612 [Papaver somniferum]|uniref:Late embryogenesis abundant protein LEA-2 subgroup domain-containing protein n=1 Tax=Papaver somniferum TaxID=3469 RepID=A0A4Y7IJM5_PAPSO|nr:hypothetical protein C5167_040612 [Papaver somniferum]
MGCNCSAACVICSGLVTIILIISGGAVCLFVFLNVVPYKHMKFHVTDASLKEFYVTNDDILHYKFAVNISVRNSNKLERISYRNIRIYPYCYGNYLPWVSLTAFWQGTKNTTLLPLVLFQGQSPVKLRGSNLKNFNNDQRDGTIKFRIIDASLTEFYMTNDDVLYYNLAVNISVRNSNKMDRTSYHGIRSNPSCYGRDLASISLPSLRQGTKNTTLLHHVFQGQSLFKLQGSHLRDFNNDQRDGICNMNVNLYLTAQELYV